MIRREGSQCDVLLCQCVGVATALADLERQVRKGVHAGDDARRFFGHFALEVVGRFDLDAAHARGHEVATVGQAVELPEAARVALCELAHPVEHLGLALHEVAAKQALQEAHAVAVVLHLGGGDDGIRNHCIHRSFSGFDLGDMPGLETQY